MNGRCEADEFKCTKGTKGCSFDYSGVGACFELSLSNQCNYMGSYSNTNCLNPDQDFGESWKRYGGAYGSNTRCWEGNFG